MQLQQLIGRHAEGIVWCGLCVLLLAPIWCVELPPMADLPQHAAQLSMMERLRAGDSMLAEDYVLNWFTPYLTGYFLTWMLARVLPLLVAIKLMLSVAMIGVPLATRWLLRSVGGDPRWAWLTFPIAYSYAFHWGFFNYVVAAPVGLLTVGLVRRFMISPSPAGGMRVWLAIVGLFFCHALMAGLLGLTGGLMALAVSRRPAELVGRLAPLAAVLPVMIAWALVTAPSIDTSSEVAWDLGFYRVGLLFSGTVGASATPRNMGFGALLFVIPLMMGAKPSRRLDRSIPLVAASALTLLMPQHVFGTGFVFERFTLFLLPFWLFALDPSPAATPALGRTGGALLAAAPAALLLVTLSSFLAFERESAPARDLLSTMPADKRVLSIVKDAESRHSPAPVYMHYATWYQVLNRGTVDFSFAAYFPQFVRYRAGAEPPLPRHFEWLAEFDWDDHEGERYDLFLVRAQEDMGDVLFGGADGQVALTDHRENWWLYERLRVTADVASVER